MKTIKLDFENGVTVLLQANPKEEKLLISVRKGTEQIEVTTNINEVRNFYEALPGVLVYYSSRKDMRA